MTSRSYRVPGMSCGHCVAAVEREISGVTEVESVNADLETKVVIVHGSNFDDAAVREAIEEAGYQADP